MNTQNVAALVTVAGEDDGYLLTYVYDEASECSELVVYNAKTMSAMPIARVMLPLRVSHFQEAFHFTYICSKILSRPQDIVLGRLSGPCSVILFFLYYPICLSLTDLKMCFQQKKCG